MTKLTALAFLLLATFAAAAQKNYDDAVDQVIAEKGKNVYLETDKAILDTSETARLEINIEVYPVPDPTEETPELQTPDVIELKPDNPLYSISNWRVVSGGGVIVGIDAANASYTAPAKFGAEKSATISVELSPLKARLPKIVLLKTIYFEENETAFVLNVPDYGIFNQRFVAVPKQGATAPKVDPKIAAKLSPEVRRQLEEAKKKMEQESMDIDLEILSSDSFAMYDDSQGLTAVSFRNFRGLQGLVQFNFYGHGKGTYDLGTRGSKTGFGLVSGPFAYGCGDVGPKENLGFCNGKVMITEFTGPTIGGVIRATIWTSRQGDKHVHVGSVYGKFKVRKAN